jgi:hypothetical protein
LLVLFDVVDDYEDILPEGNLLLSYSWLLMERHIVASDLDVVFLSTGASAASATTMSF